MNFLIGLLVNPLINFISGLLHIYHIGRIEIERNQVRVGNMDATLVLRCLSEPESEAGLRSVKISELAQKLTEIATYFSNEVSISN